MSEPTNDHALNAAAAIIADAIADAATRSIIHVHDGISEAEFVAMRTARDATRSMSKLILPFVHVNLLAGLMPPAEDNGGRHPKLPVNAL